MYLRLTNASTNLNLSASRESIVDAQELLIFNALGGASMEAPPFFIPTTKNKLPIVEFNGAVYACLYNHRDNIIALVDNTGAQVVSYSYDC